VKASKFLNIGLGILFITVISAPLITVNRTAGKISIAENRVLASRPSLKNNEGALNTRFIRDFEVWFNDNFGFRDRLVMANTKLQYSLFGNLTKTDTMIGKNGWLYYVTPEIIKDYQHLNLPTNDELKLWGDSLEQVDTFLENKGIPFIMMMNMDKKTIYPENYPDSIKKVGKISRTDLLEKYLKESSSIDFFTTKETLMNNKSKATLYSPRYDNAHWNNYGAFLGYLELMDKVKKYYPTIKSLDWDDVEVTKYPRETKIYGTIPVAEEDYAFNVKRTTHAVQSHGELDNLSLTYSKLVYSYKNSNSNGPKVLLLGDSYMYGFLLPDLAESFSELNFVHSENIDKVKMLVESLKPDIVIYENVERTFDQVIKRLLNTTETYMEYSIYKKLPSMEKPVMWIDDVNNETSTEQKNIVIDPSKQVTSISGWAIDNIAGKTASHLYLKVGDRYYSGSYGNERVSVSSYFNNADLINSGFSFYVNTSDLEKNKKVSFVIISEDQTYQYAPVEYDVVVK
jgi:alginate O-acetyltransferase complex protein AlgJ